MSWSRPRWRFLPIVVTALLVGLVAERRLGAAFGVSAADADAYWLAAERLRDGLPLYVADDNIAHLYQYAPWFAVAWVPLTALPHGVVVDLWRVVLGVSLIVLVWPLLTSRSAAGILLAVFLGSMLVRTVMIGNAHPLMLAILAWGIPRRSGPIWIGLAASLKIVPILFAVPYARKRQWRQLAIAITIPAVLWAPILFMEQVTFPSFTNPLLVVPVSLALVAAGVGIGLASRRYGVVGLAVAAMLATLRQPHYLMGYLLVPARIASAASRVSPGRRLDRS